MNDDVEVSVKDIVNFYIKINDAAKAKQDFSQLSSRDKITAFEIVRSSGAQRDFKIDVARHFLFDLDPRIRRKAELMLEELVPDWVSDPAESILKLLKGEGAKGAEQRNAAVKFLFGIVDANSLRDTFITLLNSRNRSHMTEILGILEEYISASEDEQEQVKIFDACLDIVLSDDNDQNIKFHASNLLSAFFRKVESTRLGQTLRQKFIERQVEKAEGIYRYLCSGSAVLSATFLEDLLGPLNDGGKNYQARIVEYLGYVLKTAQTPAGVDRVLDTYPDYWNQDEPAKEEKVATICRRIRRGLEGLFSGTDDSEVRDLVSRVFFELNRDRERLFNEIGSRLSTEIATCSAREKLSSTLRCFLHSPAEEKYRLPAGRLLLFRMGGRENRNAVLESLRERLEKGEPGREEKGEIAGMMETLIREQGIDGLTMDRARYLRFLSAPERFVHEDQQRSILNYLRVMAEGEEPVNDRTRERILAALAELARQLVPDKLRAAAAYLDERFRRGKTD